MRRPLAAFGFAFLAAQLFCAVFLLQRPVWLLFILAAFTLAVALWAWRRGRRAVLVVLLAITTAFCFHAGWRLVSLAPAQALAGQTVQVQAVVKCTYEVKEGDRARTDLEVMAINGAPVQVFGVSVSSMPLQTPGTVVTGQYLLLQADQYDLARGNLLRAVVTGPVTVAGSHFSIQTFFVRAQQKLSLALRSRYLPDIGGTAAAICLGDKTALLKSVQTNYRQAGAAHLLVVSGQHLAIVASVFGLLLPPRHRRLRSSLVSGVTVCFMALTGFTPSVTRAGIVVLLVAAAQLCSAEADTLTSLGAAALLLVLQNPAAAADVGLLLSYSAILGILAADALLQRKKQALINQGKQLPGWLWGLVQLVMCSAAAALATVPVLTAIGGGISLFSVVTNLVAVPLLAPLVATGLLTALLAAAGAPVLLVRPFELLCGVLVRVLNGWVALIARLPVRPVYLGGAYALAVVACVFLLGAFYLLYCPAAKRRRFAAGCAAFLFAAVLLGQLLDYGTLRVALVGSTTRPAVVASRGQQAVIIWRGGRVNADAVQTYLERNDIRTVPLLLNLGGEEVQELLEFCTPAQLCEVGQQVVAGVTFAPFDDILCTVRRQGSGSYVLLNTGGYTLLCTQGKPDVAALGTVDVLLAGGSQPKNLQARQIVTGSRPAVWLKNCPLPVASGDGATVWVRPGRSMKLMEVE